MKSNFRKALLAAAGLVVLSLPASAAGSQAVTELWPAQQGEYDEADAAGPAPVRSERRQRRLQEVEEEEEEQEVGHPDLTWSASGASLVRAEPGATGVASGSFTSRGPRGSTASLKFARTGRAQLLLVSMREEMRGLISPGSAQGGQKAHAPSTCVDGAKAPLPAIGAGGGHKRARPTVPAGTPGRSPLRSTGAAAAGSSPRLTSWGRDRSCSTRAICCERRPADYAWRAPRSSSPAQSHAACEPAPGAPRLIP